MRVGGRAPPCNEVATRATLTPALFRKREREFQPYPASSLPLGIRGYLATANRITLATLATAANTAPSQSA